MRSMSQMFSQIVTLSFILFSSQATYSEGVFKWKDAQGNTQYGDKPPSNAKLDNFKMPEITVIDGFKEQWKPFESSTKKAASNRQAVITAPVVVTAKPSVYTKLAFIAPRNNQIIKSGFDGEVSAMISVKPPLKKTHKIVFELDGKAVAKGKSRINNFSNLDGGKHTLITKIIDHRGNILKTSSPISFSVDRN